MAEITTSFQALRKVGVKLTAGERYRITVRPPVAQWLEFDNAFFRFNSSVLLPEGQEPAGTGLPVLSSGMGIVTRCLHHLSTTDKKLLVAGHTDTVGADEDNVALSDHRAACVWAALAGDRELFKTRAHGPHLASKDKKTEVQLKDRCQILDWASMEFGWPCSLAASYNDYFTAVARFQQAYNDNDHAGNPSGEDLAVDKDWGEKVWGAVFDCYETSLARNLRIPRDELPAFRSGLGLEDRLDNHDPTEKNDSVRREWRAPIG
jgi:hypothetical protein